MVCTPEIREQQSKCNCTPKEQRSDAGPAKNYTLRDLLSRETNATFVLHGQDTISGREAYIYDYTVGLAGSHWVIVGPDGHQEAPPYSGRIWIDKEHRRVLRVEQRATDFTSALPYDKAESTVEHNYVMIEGKNYLLSISGENMACFRGRADCTGTVTFGKQFTAWKGFPGAER